MAYPQRQTLPSNLDPTARRAYQNGYMPNIVTGDGDQSDPYEMAKQDRAWAFNQGNAIDQDLQSEEAKRAALEQQYRGQMDTAYGDLQTTPGYTPEETGGITRTPEMYGLLQTPDEASGGYLTGDEYNRIMRDPWQQAGYFNPDLQRSITDETAANTRGAVDRMDSGFNQYQGDQNGVFQYSGDRIRGAVDNPALGLSAEYNRDFSFTPQDEQNMVAAAMAIPAANAQARRDDVARAAAAGGYNSPMSLAASYNRMQQQGDIDAANAALQAKVAARRVGLDVAGEREATRLGAEQTQADMKARNEQQLYGTTLNALGERQGYRQQAENARLANEQAIGAARTDTQRNIEGEGKDVLRYVDQAESDRGKFLAQNRQDVQRYNQDARFGRGYQVGTNQQGATQTVADARRQGQADYRDWATGQTNFNAEAGQNAQANRIRNYGVQTGAMNDATRGYSGYDINRRGQSFGTNFKSNAGASLGNSMGSWASRPKAN